MNSIARNHRRTLPTAARPAAVALCSVRPLRGIAIGVALGSLLWVPIVTAGWALWEALSRQV
ncbi:MAG: hypothetical protein QNK05_21485 [Myxococcota bacterium]|nr:hypothetical protein [Myxococcota bacterium]